MALAALALIISQGCGFTESRMAGGPNQSDSSGTLASGTVLGYNSLKTMIFQPRCIACHGSSGGVNLETYASAAGVASAIQSAVVDQQIMPPTGPLSASDQALIQAWVSAGAPEQDITVGPSPAPSTSPGPSPTEVSPTPTPTLTSAGSSVTYSQVAARIFTPQCVRCHGNSGGVNLSTYSDVTQNLSRVEQAALTDQVMPPGSPLSASDQSLLQEWINEGAPQ